MLDLDSLQKYFLKQTMDKVQMHQGEAMQGIDADTKRYLSFSVPVLALLCLSPGRLQSRWREASEDCMGQLIQYCMSFLAACTLEYGIVCVPPIACETDLVTFLSPYVSALGPNKMGGHCVFFIAVVERRPLRFEAAGGRCLSWLWRVRRTAFWIEREDGFRMRGHKSYLCVRWAASWLHIAGLIRTCCMCTTATEPHFLPVASGYTEFQ